MTTCSNVTMIVLQCLNVTMLHILVILINNLSHPRDLFEFKFFTMAINNSCLYLMIRVFYQFYKSILLVLDSGVHFDASLHLLIMQGLRKWQPKEWQWQKVPLINIMASICFTNHQKRQLIDYMQETALNVNFKSLHSNRAKNICNVTLKFCKWGKYVTNKRSFKQFYKNNLFFGGCDKKCFRSVNYYFYAPCYIFMKHFHHMIKLV